MKKKHKVCFVLAVIFTLLTLWLAFTCVSVQIEIANIEYDESDNDEGLGAVGYAAGMVFVLLGLMGAWITLFFFSFGGVVFSAVNFKYPDKTVRVISRILLGFNGVCMAGSFGWLLFTM